MQRLRRLSRRRSARVDDDAYVIDGPVLVGEALDAGIDVLEVIVEHRAPLETVDRAERAGATVRHVDVGVLARVLDTVTPQPVAAIARRHDVAPVDAVSRAGSLALVLVAVNDPGNAGTLLRVAEASGAGAVLFCDGSVDPFNPKCVRASAGSLFRVSIASGGDAVGVLQALGDGGLTRFATTVRGATSHTDADLTGAFALVLGSEAHGLPDRLAPHVDGELTIEMVGRAESLNVGMAGAVICFEALRQRRIAGRA